MFKGRSTAEFSYPIDEEFFEEGPDGDDGEFGDDDALWCTSNRLRWSWNPVHSFADRLEIGCSLARTREETRLQTLEATERMIATNTRHCFRVSKERIREFSVEEVVIFKDPELNRTSKD